VNAESSEEILDTFEDIDQSVVTCPHILGSLVVLNVNRNWGGDDEGDTHG
jgi:hypothetical protein